MNNKTLLINSGIDLSSWDYKKNNEIGINPSLITSGSGKKAWWICRDCQTSFLRRVADYKKPYCTHCSNRHKRISQEKSLAYCYPEFLDEWDYSKNVIDPFNILPRSNIKIYWKCKVCGSEFCTSPDYRVRSNGGGCKKCKSDVISLSQSLPKKDMSFINLHADIISKYYDYEKNNFDLTKISNKSNRIAYWKCKKCGMSWTAKFQSMAEGKKCPSCESRHFKSFPEQCIFYYVNHYFADALWGNDSFKNMGISELDIYIPSNMIAVEYDGEHWHKNIKKDLKKDELCKELGIKLIRVREPLCPTYISSSIKLIRKLNHQDDHYNDLNSTIRDLLLLIDSKKDYSVNIEKDLDKIYKISLKEEFNLSFGHLFPNLALHWDYKNNGELSPENLTPHSSKKIFFICQTCGTSFQRVVASISRSEYAECNSCSRIRAGKKHASATRENSIGERYPTIAHELLNDKNKDIDIYSIFPGSTKKYWWKCSSCGELFIMSPNNRINGHACKKCGIKSRSKQRSKPVINLDTMQIFASITEASNHYHIDASCICACCNGRQKTAAGFRWAYSNDLIS